MEYSEQFEFMDPEQEMLKDQILDALSGGNDEQKAKQLLARYADEYGKDLYWQVISFDMAELDRDANTMTELHESIDYSTLGFVTRQINAARIKYIEEDFEGALEALNEVDRDKLDDSEASLVYLHLRGILNFGLKNYKEAAQCMEDVSLDIDDEQIFGIAGISYYRLGNESRAKECFAKMEEAHKDGSYEWLSELITTFHEQDILLSDMLSESIVNALGEDLVGTMNVSLDTFEMVVRSDPEMFADVLKKQLQDPNQSENEMAVYMMAVCYEALGDQKNAAKFYRKVVRMPIDMVLMVYTDATSPLQLKLTALDWLGYSKKVQSNYLRTYFNQNKADPASLVALYEYASVNQLINVMRDMLREAGLPVCQSEEEEGRLARALMVYNVAIDDYLEAYTHARYMYDNDLFPDPFSVSMASQLMWVLDDDYPGLPLNQDEYDVLLTYVHDLMLVLMRTIFEEDIKTFKYVFNKINHELDPVNHFEWDNMVHFLLAILPRVLENRRFKSVWPKVQAFIDKYEEDELDAAAFVEELIKQHS
ncbi:tetratricopeptide repeat protein [Erysipelotrichaceae bacterium RD49]|nr:tetratricopeptide repeat protein [Erysipelotrichaceae bacterium RD49]